MAVAAVVSAGAVLWGTLQWYAARPLPPRKAEQATNLKKPTPKAAKKSDPVVQQAAEKNHDTETNEHAGTPPAQTLFRTKKAISAEGHPAKPKKSPAKVVEGVRLLQFAVTKRKYLGILESKRRKLEKMGLDCFIRDAEDGASIYLFCHIPRQFDPIAGKLTKHHIDYFIVDAAKVGRRVKTPVNPPAAASDRVEERPKIDRNPRLDEMAEASRRSPPARIRVREVQDPEALAERFGKYPDYETALRIARIYKERKKYAEAAAWAKKANLLDRDDERAWILYAEAEHAMGHKERAKRILKLFLDYKESKRARTLLVEWSGS